CADGMCTKDNVRAVHVDPRNPKYEADADGVELLSEFMPSNTPNDYHHMVKDVSVVDTTAYIITGDSIRTVDVSDPTKPHEIGALVKTDAPEEYNDIEILDRPGSKRFAIVGSNKRGLVVFDVTDPASLQEVANWPGSGGAAGEQIVHTVFLQERPGGIQVR